MLFLLIILFMFFPSVADTTCVAKTSIISDTHYDCSLKKDASLITAGVLCGLTASLVENSVHPLSAQDIGRLSPGTVNRFDRSATKNYSPAIDDYSYLLAGALMAAPFALLANGSIRNNLVSFSSMYLEVLLFSYAVPSFGKGIAERKRPYVYNPSVPMGKKQEKDAYASFFSRHTTYAFASSVFLSTLYDNYFPESTFRAYLWTISLLGASAVGYMRYQSGSHFPTDILTGAAVGSVIGFGIPWLHQQKSNHTKLSFDPFKRAVGLSWNIVLSGR